MTTAGPLVPGSVFAERFRIERPLAEGGMGQLYAVTNLATSHPCALKLLSADGCFDDELRARFLSEARNTPSDASDHIVKVLDAGVERGRPWIAMELLDGATLHEHVTRHGALSRDELRSVFAQLCHGLAAAHARGVVHRDLKPDNVFLQLAKSVHGGVFVKVLDFGVAKALDPGRARGTASIAVGTQGWWAPEQVFGGGVSPATDVWALGLLAYWCATGKAFLDGGMPQQPMLTTASSRAREQGVAERLPEGFDAWFAHCVTWEPTGRFRDASAAWRALDAVLTRAQTPPIAETRMSLTSPVAHGTSPTLVAQTPNPIWQAPSYPPTASLQQHQFSSLPGYGVASSTRTAPPTNNSRWQLLVGLLGLGFVLSFLGAAAVFRSAKPDDLARTPTAIPPPPIPRPRILPPRGPEDRPLTDFPQLRTWLERWTASATNVAVADPLSGTTIAPEPLEVFYAPNAGFHDMVAPTLDQITRRWLERRTENRFIVHFESSIWRPAPTSSIGQRCRNALGGEVLLLALDAEEAGPTVVARAVSPTCRIVMGAYLLSVRHDGHDWRICNETWHRDALRNSCRSDLRRLTDRSNPVGLAWSAP